LIYLIGFHLRAGELECNELSIVDVLPNAQLARHAEASGGAVVGEAAVLRGQTYCSIYSPNNNSYPLKSSQRYAAIRSDNSSSTGPSQGMRGAIIQRGNGFEAEGFVRVWTTKLFISDWLDAATNPFTVNIKPEGNRWHVTVGNLTGHSIKDARIVLRQRIFSLGELRSGTSEYTLSPEMGRILLDFANQLSSSLFQGASTRSGNFRDKGQLSSSLAEYTMALSFSSLFNNTTGNSGTLKSPSGLDLAPYATQTQAILLAFDQGRNAGAPLAQFKAKRTQTDTLYRLTVPLPAN
jgi:hypothetical protein